MDKTNYRPVSNLPSISKIYERLLYSQIETFIENKLSYNQCGFRKGYSAQYCLIKMLTKWKSALTNRSQRVKVNSEYSIWSRIQTGVPKALF